MVCLYFPSDHYWLSPQRLQLPSRWPLCVGVLRCLQGENVCRSWMSIPTLWGFLALLGVKSQLLAATPDTLHDLPCSRSQELSLSHAVLTTCRVFCGLQAFIPCSACIHPVCLLLTCLTFVPPSGSSLLIIHSVCVRMT